MIYDYLYKKIIHIIYTTRFIDIYLYNYIKNCGISRAHIET